ncbi:WD repeat-containing protein 6 [Pleosporales sp. CAS-2024a]
MTPALDHECTRLPVTALASCGTLLVAAEGPFLKFYHAKNSRYIASERVFKAQAVHGISVYSESYPHVVKLVVWGGRLIRALVVRFATGDNLHQTHLHVRLSAVATSPDWILDLAPRFSSLENAAADNRGECVAVTAHNALVQILIHRQHASNKSAGLFGLSVSELTSGSRSILYSAHVFWESEDCVLVAAGTAFGEIMYWSWTRTSSLEPSSKVHRVFLGHEGSIFGVRISKELPSGCCQSLKRIIASCSDDRTIRIWDVSDVAVRGPRTATSMEATASERTQHTGFSNAAVDSQPFSSSQCLAVGWGHASRVWTVQFLDSTPCEGALFLVSSGEDASSRTWKLGQDESKGAVFPYKLLQQDVAAHHSGKNIWSCVAHGEPTRRQYIVCGGADSKITSRPLARISDKSRESTAHEYKVGDIMSLAQAATKHVESIAVQQIHKSSQKADFVRSYCFIDHDSFLVTTNSGSILIGTTKSPCAPDGTTSLDRTTLVDRLVDLSGYSVCAGETSAAVAFVAGSAGLVYMYSRSTSLLSQITSFDSKIGDMFAATVLLDDKHAIVALLLTLVGKREARLLLVDVAKDATHCIMRTMTISLSELPPGSMATSMTLGSSVGNLFLYIGFRRGSIVIYDVSNDSQDCDHATLLGVIDKAHGEETVTALRWTRTQQDPLVGYLASVGRDGCLGLHRLDMDAGVIELVHKSTLAIGPNVEGLYFHQDHVIVHGFSSKTWVLYDVMLEDEVMSVETGGAHRSWAFEPNPAPQEGGTLVWTRASSMHVRGQIGSNHRVIRSGGHGREIKAVAISPGPGGRQLIATGAEDTDIKIFQYVAGELCCRRTLRRHTTGIQHLQWSEDGEYLFSSGGCEEFYIWRVRHLPHAVGIGVVCDFTYTPESEHADLRIMSFDVQKRAMGYDIAMVFSDSSLKVYRYRPLSAVKLQTIARGLYFTSCLTQCLFLSSERVWTAGTDGHAAVWPLPNDESRTPPDSLQAALHWQQPVRIHQSSSKAMAALDLDTATKLIVSAGDDGSLAVLLLSITCSSGKAYAAAPVLVSRSHASAVTSCAVVMHQGRLFLLSSGNDQWVRLWELCIGDNDDDDSAAAMTTAHASEKKMVAVKRLSRTKTNVADVSSIAVLGADEDADATRVLVCGVGMEVIRLEWKANQGSAM